MTHSLQWSTDLSKVLLWVRANARAEDGTPRPKTEAEIGRGTFLSRSRVRLALGIGAAHYFYQRGDRWGPRKMKL